MSEIHQTHVLETQWKIPGGKETTEASAPILRNYDTIQGVAGTLRKKLR